MYPGNASHLQAGESQLHTGLLVTCSQATHSAAAASISLRQESAHVQQACTPRHAHLGMHTTVCVPVCILTCMACSTHLCLVKLLLQAYGYERRHTCASPCIVGVHTSACQNTSQIATCTSSLLASIQLQLPRYCYEKCHNCCLLMHDRHAYPGMSAS